MSRYGQVSKGFLPMSPGAVLLHTPWTFTVMAKLNALDSQHILNLKSPLKDTKPSILQPSDTHTHFYQKEAVWIWAPRGLGKRLKPWLPTKRALQTLTPAASVSRFASWLGLFAFLRHTQGGVCLLSSCKIQLPKIYNQLLQCCAHHLLSQRSETSQQSISAAKRQLWKPDFTISFGKS